MGGITKGVGAGTDRIYRESREKSRIGASRISLNWGFLHHVPVSIPVSCARASRLPLPVLGWLGQSTIDQLRTLTYTHALASTLAGIQYGSETCAEQALPVQARPARQKRRRQVLACPEIRQGSVQRLPRVNRTFLPRLPSGRASPMPSPGVDQRGPCWVERDEPADYARLGLLS